MRQAVVVIHGIGEQRPMTTLREFVKGIIKYPSDKNLPFYSKPDRLSDTLELRRLTVEKKHTSGTSTDFYEFYWQHLMTGTTPAHIQAWVEILLLRNHKHVPKKLKPYWYSAWILIFLGLLIVLLLFSYFLRLGGPPDIKGISAVVMIFFVRPLLIPLLQYFGVKFGLKYVGDAARYLSPLPENVGVRHAIRSAGLDLLRRLHLDPLRRYDRIIVVGHSLGSVIAYDVLTYLWQEMHSKVERLSPTNGSPELEELLKDSKENESPAKQPELDALLKEMESTGHDQSQWSSLQRRLLKEYSDIYEYKDKEFVSSFPWRITDLVTLGSPLTYADFLLADKLYPFSEKVKQREFPTCPPQPEDPRDEKDNTGDGSLLCRVIEVGAQKRRIRTLHHAALFACTRWTNLYFPGDIIAGPLACKFGWGIKDISLRGCSAKNLTSHVKYWAKEENFALDQLIEALRLGEDQEKYLEE
jgi:hypothetical protein